MPSRRAGAVSRAGCSSVIGVRSLVNRPWTWPQKSMAAAVALPAVAALTLTGCAEQMFGTDGEDGPDGEGETVVGVAAEPSDSPGSPGASDATGTLDDGDEVLGLVRAGLGDAVSADSPAPVAALEQGRLSIGSLDDLAAGRADTVEVDDSCTTITGAVDGVVLGCGTSVRILDTEGQEQRRVDAPGEVTSAAVHPDGTVALTVDSDSDVYWFTPEGEEAQSEDMTATASAMQLVGNTRNDEDGDPEWRAALIDAAQTSVTDIDIADHSRLAALRIGQGVGTVSAGTEADGVLVASDARRNQALVYTLTDVIRHTQSVPTGEGAWAVLWDSEREVMWVSTTADNMLTGYELSTGTPVEVGQVPTAPDVRHIIDDGSGDLLLVTADGTRELISSDDLPRKD
ncbi:Hypothetical protein CGLY_08645 [Corynebacterium glyciniphilum AJ 3170]|uniref:Uncharacterized protein n=1 Tax=Corynebacterium glyciniphilum AJ 3170 TaxID=1404245 RepID=X5DSA4_9CORY|nr:Hypothetical protein CGLY_08645 [Corynebacterium glyciniphilum AJ 3170]